MTTPQNPDATLRRRCRALRLLLTRIERAADELDGKARRGIERELELAVARLARLVRQLDTGG